MLPSHAEEPHDVEDVSERSPANSTARQSRDEMISTGTSTRDGDGDGGSLDEQGEDGGEGDVERDAERELRMEVEKQVREGMMGVAGVGGVGGVDVDEGVGVGFGVESVRMVC